MEKWFSDKASRIDRHSKVACQNVDPEIFYPVGESSIESKDNAREAKRVCSGCAVRVACLDWAIENNEKFGIWGGQTERERKATHQRQQRIKRNIGKSSLSIL